MYIVGMRMYLRKNRDLKPSELCLAYVYAWHLYLRFESPQMWDEMRWG